MSAAARKAKESSGFWGIIAECAAGVGAAGLGVLLAMGVLTATPIPIVKAPPAEEGGPRVFWVERPSLPPNRSGWELRAAAVRRGQPGDWPFSRAELNAWTDRIYTKLEPRDFNGIRLDVKRPEFWTVGDEIVAGVPATYTLLGLAVEVRMQVRGRFEGSPGALQFVPSALHLNSLRLPREFGLEGRVFDAVRESFPVPDDVQQAWPRIRAIQAGAEGLTVGVM